MHGTEGMYMANKGRSDRGLFGSVYHYDEHGNKIGRSDPNILGGYTNYDANGKRIGHSNLGILGGYTNYDANGKRIGHSDPGLLGGYQHYDANGHHTGSSDPGLFGGYSHNDNQGCYVATCVYGSYDCPQVWTLRRFRDDTLAESPLGRAFIHTYYAVSPTIVKWFGSTRWFRKLWKGVLDRMVQRLNEDGVENTPYCDKEWR